jgi:hypothetical protein
MTNRMLMGVSIVLAALAASLSAGGQPAAQTPLRTPDVIYAR